VKPMAGDFRFLFEPSAALARYRLFSQSEAPLGKISRPSSKLPVLNSQSRTDYLHSDCAKFTLGSSRRRHTLAIPRRRALGALLAMSVAPASRAVLRQSRLLLRRNNFRQASTTSEAATKAQETGQQAVSKASEGLSKVQSSAGAAASRVGASAYSALSRIGGRTGRMISFVECKHHASRVHQSRRET
jgi:hypothetical protein